MIHGHARHIAHAHIGHAAQRTWVERRHRALHAGARRECAARETAAIDRLGEDGESAIGVGLHNHVVGLGRADAEFIDGDRLDIVAVGLDDGELQPRDTHIEDAHRGAVDETKAHALAGTEQRRPIAGGRLAVDEIGVGGARDIEDVGRAHAHFAPFEAIRDRRGQSLLLHIAQEGARRALPEIVMVALEFKVAHDCVGTFVTPVGQQHDVIAIELLRVTSARLDDDRAVQAALFLKPRMAVIPIGAALMDRETVGEGFAGCDAGETQTRHPVHLRGRADAVPMDRAWLG